MILVSKLIFKRNIKYILIFRQLQSFKAKSKTRGAANSNRGRFVPYQSKPRNQPQDALTAILAALQNKDPPRSSTGNTDNSLAKANIVAQKQTSKCSRCGVVG